MYVVCAWNVRVYAFGCLGGGGVVGAAAFPELQRPLDAQRPCLGAAIPPVPVTPCPAVLRCPPDYRYIRIDGKTPASERQKLVGAGGGWGQVGVWYGRLRRQLRKVFLRWRAGGGRGTSATLSVCGRSPRLCRLTQGCTLNLPRDAHHSDCLLTRPPAFLPLIILAGQPLPGERGRQGGHPLHTCRRRGPHPHGQWATPEAVFIAENRWCEPLC